MKWIGIYGLFNVGKMIFVNCIVCDWIGDVVGFESYIFYEICCVRWKENVEIEWNGKKVIIDIVDILGVMMKVDYKEFFEYDMEKDDVVCWFCEVIEGVVEVMYWFCEDVDGVIYVFDSMKDLIL